MKKFLSTSIFIILFVAVAFSQQVQKKLWNDGSIDYLPLGAKVRLEDNGLDEKAGNLYYTENFSEPFEYSGPISLTEEGQVWFSYGTQDIFGTVSSIKNYTAIVDGTAPELKYLIDGPTYTTDEGTFFFTSETAFLVYGEDNLSGIEYIYARLNDDAYEDIANSDFLVLDSAPDGEYYVEGFLVDYVGNATEVLGAYAYLDDTAPVLEILVDKTPVDINNTTFVDPKARISIEASDELSGVSGIYVSLNGSEFAKYEEESQIPFKGNHILRAYAVDMLGNKSDITSFEFSNNLALPEPDLGIEID